jgi:hypothetical protein
MTIAEGVQRDFPLTGVWGCPPDNFLPPLLKERGTGGEVNRKCSLIKSISAGCIRVIGMI